MVASTIAHGDATIMNVIARSRVASNGAPNSNGTTSRARVAVTMPIE
jgi:hypothetical protein